MCNDSIDKRSFILGMITAFCECVAGGCKRLALSPPLSGSDRLQIFDEAIELIEKHGLLFYHEKNADLPASKRFEWIVIASKRDTIDKYLELRKNGLSPAVSLVPFFGLLSYDPEESVSTGFDAYHELFPARE